MAAASAAVLLVAGCGGGGPQSGGDGKLTDDKIVLGVLNDQSGVYAELSGKNSVKAVEMAIADFKAKYGDKAVDQEHQRGDRRPPEQAGHRQHQGRGAVRPQGAST